MVNAARLVLGTAQWGMQYGIANRDGRPDTAQIEPMLDFARQHGVDTLDTAHDYGEAEQRLGTLLAGDEHWRVVTKLAADVVRPGETTDEALRRANRSLDESRSRLRRERLDTLLLHRASHRLALDGAVWKLLREQVAAGAIGRLGVSALSVEEALDALKDPSVSCIQVAGNLLDRRCRDAGVFLLARERGVELFVRSVYLQGAALIGPAQLPQHLEPLAGPLQAIRRWSNEARRPLDETLLLHTLQRCGGRPIVGCESMCQLRSNLDAMRAEPLSDEQLRQLDALIPELPRETLDPWRWPD